MRIYEPAVRRHAVAGLKPDSIARNQRLGREAGEVAIAQHPRLRSRQGFQSGESRFRSLFLIETKRRVEQEYQADSDPFNGPSLHTLVEPQAEIKGQCEEQNIDEWARELTHKPAPQWIGNPFGAARLAQHWSVVRSPHWWKDPASVRQGASVPEARRAAPVQGFGPAIPISTEESGRYPRTLRAVPRPQV